jgi:MFS family permease
MTDFAASTGSVRLPPPARVRGAMPWIIWTLGTLTYLVAIVGRSSLAGLGTGVAVRFDAGSTTLALFATLQLAVYGAMQVPAGLLLDRFGARAVVTAGMLTMAGGSIWLAFAGDAPTAIAARVLTGAGDAMIFPSVLRLLTLWFPPRRVPLFQQITAQTGQLGQVVSVIALTALVDLASWEIAFGALAAIFVLFAILDLALVRERAARESSGPGRPRQSALVAAAVREPGTRLGFWIHFVTPFAGTAFALLWGIPFLTAGEGLSGDTAGILIVIFVLSGAVFAPVMGLVSGARPARRPLIAVVSVVAQAMAFGAILITPGPAPLWLLITWVVTLSSGGAASMVAFDVARRDNPLARLSTATGVVNMGGFIAALIAVYLIGLTLDLQHADPAAYTRGELRTAMSSVFVLWAVGLAGIVVEARRRRRAHGSR